MFSVANSKDKVFIIGSICSDRKLLCVESINCMAITLITMWRQILGLRDEFLYNFLMILTKGITVIFLKRYRSSPRKLFKVINVFLSPPELQAEQICELFTTEVCEDTQFSGSGFCFLLVLFSRP